MALTFCTIISKNYLSYARVLAQSVRIHHPKSRLFVLLTDNPENFFDPQAESFECISMGDLGIADLPRFCFQYQVLELNTAVKPYFLNRLFRTQTIEKLVYLDPDVLVLNPMEELDLLLDRHPIILTPHITRPFGDSQSPDERDVLRAGIFNLGFIAMRRSDVVRECLRWWQKKLYSGCRVSPAEGYFVDQKWMDLAMAYWDIHILRKPGYNVAYWNLHERKIDFSSGSPAVSGMPCYFFHFSGFDPLKACQVSKYQNRFTMDLLGEAKQLFHLYAGKLIRNGYLESRLLPYTHNYFDNGIRISNHARGVYLRLGDGVKRFGNPFLSEIPTGFYQWYCQTLFQPRSSVSPALVETG